jgi:flagellar basal-body rod protein FlgC
MGMIPGIEASSSALQAEQTRLQVVAGNLANAQNTKDANGQVYRRKMVVFQSAFDSAVNSTGAVSGQVETRIVDDPSPLQKVFMPNNPQADANGMVEMPNINPLDEMVDMMTSTRAYQANLQVIQAGRSLFESALKIVE